MEDDREKEIPEDESSAGHAGGGAEPTPQVEDEGVRELDPMEQIALAALAAGMTHAEVGLLVQHNAKWIQRRLKEPRFASALAAARSQRLVRVLDLLDAGLEPAVNVLIEALEDDDPRSQLRAADLLLRSSIKLRSVVRVEESLAELRADMETLRQELLGGEPT